ncbi:MAG TPA: type II toxin-antitoxin system RelB/DinJ family antitoxin [Patescibacteria group bacterium]|nr:type II toxin-antitoxin system RelB/DinJ family antitoxin [Patescibacteria group bacterium]
MNTAIVNVKVDPQVKKQAQKLAGDLGLSLSGLINAYLKQIIRTKTVSFSASAEEPSEYLIKSLKESKEDIKAGRVVSFDDPDKALAFLDKMITNEKKLQKN